MSINCTRCKGQKIYTGMGGMRKDCDCTAWKAWEDEIAAKAKPVKKPVIVKTEAVVKADG